MSDDRPNPEDLIKASLEASFYLSAREPGLTSKELIAILVSCGVPPGEADDVVRASMRAYDLAVTPTGRIFFARDDSLKISVFDFLIPFDEDPRDRGAVTSLHRWMLATARQQGVQKTQIGRSEALAFAAEHGFRERDVHFTLEAMTRLGLLVRDDERERYRTSEYILKWAVLGSQPDSIPKRRRPAFSAVLKHVEATLAARSPQVRRRAILDSLADICFTGPSDGDAQRVLDWFVTRFADTAVPVRLETAYIELPDLDAKAIAWRLANSEFLTILSTASDPSAVPTAWGAMLRPDLLADALIMLDEALQRACELRLQSKTTCPLFGSGGLLHNQEMSNSARRQALHLIPSLRPFVAAGPDPNAVVEIHDEIRKYDRLSKFLKWKAKSRATASVSARAAGERAKAPSTGGGTPITLRPSVGRITGFAARRSDGNQLLLATDDGQVHLYEMGPRRVSTKWSCWGDDLRVGWVEDSAVAWVSSAHQGQLWILNPSGGIDQSSFPAASDVVCDDRGLFVAAPGLPLALHERQSDGSWSVRTLDRTAGSNSKGGTLSAPPGGAISLVDSAGGCEYWLPADPHWRQRNLNAHGAAIANDGLCIAATVLTSDGSYLYIYEISRGVVQDVPRRTTRLWTGTTRSITWSLDDRTILAFSDGGDVRLLEASSLRSMMWSRSSLPPQFHPAGSLVTVNSKRDALYLQSIDRSRPTTWTHTSSSPSADASLSFRSSGAAGVRCLGDLVLSLAKGPPVRPFALYEIVEGRARHDPEEAERSAPEAKAKLLHGLPAIPDGLLDSEQARLKELSRLSSLDEQATAETVGMLQRLFALEPTALAQIAERFGAEPQGDRTTSAPAESASASATSQGSDGPAPLAQPAQHGVADGRSLTRMKAIELFREMDATLTAAAEASDRGEFSSANENVISVADRGSLLIPAIPIRFDFSSIWAYQDRGLLPEDRGAPIGSFVRRLSHYQTAVHRVLSILCDDALWSLYGAYEQSAHAGSSREAEVSRRMPQEESVAELSNRCDIVVICALHDPELAQLRRQAGGTWTEVAADAADPHTYFETTLKTGAGKELRVIAGAPNQMGLSASSVLATKMILRFRPKLVAMVGIAAGSSTSKQGYGDVLAAEHTFDYGSGKIEDTTEGTKFRPDHKPLDVDTRIVSRLREWASSKSDVLDGIRRGWQSKPPSTALQVHVGPLASGAAVVADGQTVAGILEHWRKLVGLEMEAYGVHRACRDTIQPAPLFACFKSICDFADSDKNNDWQPYAAYVAASFFREFVATDWGRLFPGQ